MSEVTQTEYWFLNLVVTLRCPLSILEDQDLELHVNGPGHNLAHSELVAALYRLFQGGDLVAHCWDECESDVEFLPSEAEIEAGLQNCREIYFGLTAQGGAKWEAASHPDWKRYIDGSIGTEEGAIICATPHLAAEYLSLQSNNVTVVEGQIWDVLSPWQATYWKMLPQGHRVRYWYWLDESEEAHVRYWSKYEENLRELDRLNKWYTNPFERNP